MKISFILSFCFFITLGYSQEKKLTCKDFKKGVFYSVSEKDSFIFKTIIIRKDSIQTEEILNKSDTNLSKFHRKIHVKLKWINDCDYIVKFDESKGKIDDISKLINDNGGVKTEMIQIKDKCYYYKSSLKINGITEVINGKICKGVSK